MQFEVTVDQRVDAQPGDTITDRDTRKTYRVVEVIVRYWTFLVEDDNDDHEGPRADVGRPHRREDSHRVPRRVRV